MGGRAQSPWEGRGLRQGALNFLLTSLWRFLVLVAAEAEPAVPPLVRTLQQAEKDLEVNRSQQRAIQQQMAQERNIRQAEARSPMPSGK